MAIRRAHGTEQPRGIPEEPDGEKPGDRDHKGRFRPGNSLAARGGRRRREIARYEAVIARDLGLENVPNHMRPILHQAREWADVQMRWLAETVGGGQVGPDAGALVQAAARAWYAHLDVTRQAVDSGGDPKLYTLACTLADKARMQILTARDLCATAAQSRPQPSAIQAYRDRVLNGGDDG